ncbi:MAG: hypothetical protein MRY78_14595 [Saprospiraceae bacterium]|nr:hypothetical protein [Saprospiraceae bacterium]
MSLRYKRGLFFILFLFFIWWGRGLLYRTFVKYKTVQNIPVYSLPSVNCPDDYSLEAVVSGALDTLAEQLIFVWESAPTKPEAVLQAGKANCIGYAACTAAYLEACLRKQQKKEAYRIKHVRAQIHLFGYNVHQWIDHPFFRDHDIVVIEDATGQTILKIDPSLYDYFGIRSVR